MGWRIVLFVAAVLILLLFQAFQADKELEELKPEVAALIEEAVQEKLNGFVRTRRKACRQRVLLRANEVVDSLLLAQAKLSNYDTIGKPLKLPKPLRPDVESVQPASAIRPLWQKDGD